jgi:hypothetical protein
MSFDRRGRPVLMHAATPENFFESAKCHPSFDPFCFRPLAEPVVTGSFWAALELLSQKKTSGPSPFLFRSSEMSGAVLASTISLGSMLRIQIDDILLVSNFRIRHAVAKTVRAWLDSRDDTIEVWFWGVYNDGWKNALVAEYNYCEHQNGVSVYTTNA